MLSSRIALLAAPPRRVPLAVVSSTMLGITGILGAIFLIFGLVFTAIFASGLNLLDELRLSNSKTTAQATITQVNATNSTENKVRVYEYRFTFRTPREQTIESSSYSTGRIYAVGDTANVLYVPDKPTVAQLENTRRSLFPSLILVFILIFPLVGAGLFISSIVRGRRQVNLLRQGQIAGAVSLTVQSTNMSVNHQPVMKYSYEFATADGQSYPGSSNALPKPQLGDEAQEPVLYLPSNPKVSMLVDALPLRYPLDVDENGQWSSDNSPASILWYGLVWLGIIASLFSVCSRLLG